MSFTTMFYQLDAALIALIAWINKKPVLLTYHCDLHLPPASSTISPTKGPNLANHLTTYITPICCHKHPGLYQSFKIFKTLPTQTETDIPPVEVTPITQQDLDHFRHKYQIEPNNALLEWQPDLLQKKVWKYLAEALPIILEKHPTAASYL